MNEETIFEMIEKSHLGEALLDFKEIYEKNKDKNIASKSKGVTIGNKCSIDYNIITSVEHYSVVGELANAVNKYTNNHVPHDLPPGFTIYTSNKKRFNSSLIYMSVRLSIDNCSVTFNFGYIKPTTN